MAGLIQFSRVVVGYGDLYTESGSGCCSGAVESQVAFDIRSDVAGMDELLLPYAVGDAVRGRLLLGDSWTRRWSAAWKVGGGEVVWPVREMAAVQLEHSEPVRRFTWRARQRHRPGLQFMVSTGRHHGFESLEEQRLLLALDFTRVSEVLPQPMRLRFEHAEGSAEHIPDFLAFTEGGCWLLDVRPGGLIRDLDALKFAAAAETATACGWRYSVVTGWRAHVQTNLDALSAQRRPLTDPLGLRDQVRSALARGPLPFKRLAEETSLPAVARAQLVHMLWHRELAIDLSRPLADSSLVRGPAGREAG
ncbi:TnsA-like heteromeric transposase endonuclease subunit [Streptomyces goshikiensis]|uniref:TnsA-like heteromeric transposase endonuclease subunit n=1 Tax=Streptomyces goshikiensis TaxID=1942 RepID=UPI0037154FD0